MSPITTEFLEMPMILHQVVHANETNKKGLQSLS